MLRPNAFEDRQTLETRLTVVRTVVIVCLALLAVGTLVFLRSRAYYARIGSDVAPRSHGIAALVAGSAGIFWLLFALLLALAWLGVTIE